MSTPFPTGETLTVTSTEAGLGSVKYTSSDHAVDAARYTLAAPPKPVGYWIMPGSHKTWQTKFSAYEKPRWHVRKMMLWVFGWDWEDAKST